MKPFKKILVPTDFSPHSLEAVRTGVDLARRYEGSLTLVHVYDPVAYALPEGYVLFTPPQFEKLIAALEQQLEGSKQVAREAGAAEVETRLLQGFPAGEIVDFAASAGIDLIVMGTHGRTGAKHLFLGSVAERVVRTAPCPVLTLKAESR